MAGFNSSIRKVTITLSNMEGEEVAKWVKNIGATLDQLDPIANDIPDI